MLIIGVSTAAAPSTIMPLPNSLPERPSTQLSNARPDRTIRDINEAKSMRRAEIERRCMTLVPPIPPSILCHMQSFQAALQIPRPLNEREWAFLKPNLLEQRSAAEVSEADRLEQERILLERIGDPTQHEDDLKEAREVPEREWEAIQAPVRERLARHADDFIQSRWSNGALITQDNCPDFAAGLLIYCRRQFYDEIGAAKPSNPPYMGPRKLILENMKWLFDNKIKVHTEGYQKELFLCNTCAASSKYYGFEAVVQHYAAKHTSSLSVGSVIVHWRAEWPEEQPFHPHPSAVMQGSVPAPIAYGTGPGAVQSMQTTFADAPTAYAPGVQPAVPSAAPSPFTVQAFPEPSNGYYPGSPPMFAGQPVFPHMAGVPVQSVPSAMPSPYQSSPQLGYGYQPPPRAPPGPAQGFPYSHPHVAPGSFQANAYPNGGNFPYSNSGFDLYQRQMADMAKIAREVWFGINGVKDMPQSVRIYVVIHHVVSRFQKLHTNEPSLSMFIDGLHDNPLMRPVRSLNGLACKACVSKSQAPPGSYARSQHHALDRRLFTLPLLLNHFRSSHVEGGLATIDFQTGMEASRMDWKRDMIELPDAPIIRDTVNADGMDVKKLELMRPAFPEIFGSSEISSPASDFRFQASHTAPHSYGRSSNHGHRGTHSGASSTRNEPISSRSYSSLDFVSHSSPGSPEPVTEHEYDPRRPADFGKIIESNHLSRPRSKLSGVSSVEHKERPQEPLVIRGATGDLQDDRQHLTDQGAYSSQLLRHHDRFGNRQAQSDPMNPSDGGRSSRLGASLLSSDTDGTGDVKSLPATKDHSSQQAAEEADKFLNDLKPPSVSILQSEAETHHYDQLRQGTISRSSRHSAAPRARDGRSEIVTLVEASTPRTPPSGNARPHRQEPDDSASPKDDDHYSPPDHSRSSPRIIYVRDERSGPSEYPPPYARRSNQIIYLDPGAERDREAGWPESGARYYQSPTRRDYDHLPQATVYQHSAPHAYYADAHRYLVPEPPRGSPHTLGPHEISHDSDAPSRRHVQYIPVRRDEYDAPRYYAPRSPNPPHGYAAPAGYRLESGYGRYTVLVPEGRRDYGTAPGTPADVVEYRERR